MAVLNPKLYKIVKNPEKKRFQFTLDDAITDPNAIGSNNPRNQRAKMKKMQRRGKVDKDGNLVKKGNSSEKK